MTARIQEPVWPTPIAYMAVAAPTATTTASETPATTGAVASAPTTEATTGAATDATKPAATEATPTSKPNAEGMSATSGPLSDNPELLPEGGAKPEETAAPTTTTT